MAKYLLVVPGTVISNELAPALMKLASRCNPSGQAHILKYFLRKYSKKIFPKKKVLLKGRNHVCLILLSLRQGPSQGMHPMYREGREGGSLSKVGCFSRQPSFP